MTVGAKAAGGKTADTSAQIKAAVPSSTSSSCYLLSQHKITIKKNNKLFYCKAQQSKFTNLFKSQSQSLSTHTSF